MQQFPRAQLLALCVLTTLLAEEECCRAAALLGHGHCPWGPAQPGASGVRGWQSWTSSLHSHGRQLLQWSQE